MIYISSDVSPVCDSQPYSLGIHSIRFPPLALLGGNADKETALVERRVTLNLQPSESVRSEALRKCRKGWFKLKYRR